MWAPKPKNMITRRMSLPQPAGRFYVMFVSIYCLYLYIIILKKQCKQINKRANEVEQNYLSRKCVYAYDCW